VFYLYCIVSTAYDMLFIHLNAEHQLCFGHLPIRCYRCRCCVSQTRSSKLLQNNNSSISKVWVYDYNLLKATFIILNHILNHSIQHLWIIWFALSSIYLIVYNLQEALQNTKKLLKSCNPTNFHQINWLPEVWINVIDLKINHSLDYFSFIWITLYCPLILKNFIVVLNPKNF